MFKRANKITALLVAAASVMSIVPAMASERLGTKDGTLNYGIAFDGGKYIYDGYRTDDDNTGIYYNSGDKDKLVEDLEDYEIVSKYGSKYAFATDNNDQYLVDLSTGKVVDNETDEEKRDTIQGKLRSTLKKTDRYSLTENFDNVTVADRLFTDNNQFGDVWYQYSALGDGTYTAGTTVAAAAPTITIKLPGATSKVQELFEAGKTTVKVFGSIVTITAASTKTSFEDDVKDIVNTKAGALTGMTATYDETTGVIKLATIAGNAVSGKVSDANYTTFKNAFTGITDLDLTNYSGYNGLSSTDKVSYTGFVNEDGKYIDASNLGNIYAYSNKAEKVVKVEEFSDYDSDNQIMVALDSIKPIAQDKDYIYTITTVNIYQGDTEAGCTQNNNSESRKAYFYQKIAKAQGDKKDDAYIPKTVDSYEIDNKTFYDDGDANDAYAAVLKDDDGYLAADNLYTVKDGTLYVVRVKTDKVKIFKMKTKKVKADTVDTGAAVANVKDKAKKLDAPLLQKDGDGDHDIFDGSGRKAVSLDIDGNVWALDKGSIYKADGTDFKEIYTLDRSIDNLDVYNDGSLIAWEGLDNGDEGKVYTTVTEGKVVTTTEAPAATPAKVGWDKLADGTWNFYDATGAKVVNNWANVGGVWYFLKADGVMATGWQNLGGTWYYLASSGAMATGWLNDNGTWYYLNANGSMAANTTVDGYVLNASGAWVK